ncbi:MAG: phage regulatory CII family protein [Desulfovibrionaceae bacterium]|nr:phage regulatory CII family protein [Desulfovibrionaceae bacterium]
MPSFTLPEVVAAVQKAAQAWGIERLAVELGMRPSSLYNALNPRADRSVVKLGLEQAMQIMEITGDTTALELMAARLGLVTRELDSRVPDRATTPEELMDDMTEQGRLAAMMRDGAPMEDVERQAQALIDEIHQTVTRYRMDLEAGKIR